jgi:hypothetical protein
MLMQCIPRRHLRPVASMLMLVAVLAFAAQVTMIIVSQVAASNRSMPHPAVAVSGGVHYHDGLARHLHVHGGKDAPGHTHDPADQDEHAAAQVLIVTLGVAAADIPSAISASLPTVFADMSHYPAQAALDGLHPDGLNRPPSTPDIA